jgi:hypothetical protein
LQRLHKLGSVSKYSIAGHGIRLDVVHGLMLNSTTIGAFARLDTTKRNQVAPYFRPGTTACVRAQASVRKASPLQVSKSIYHPIAARPGEISEIS